MSYREDLTSYAQGLKDEHKAGDIDDMQDAIWQLVDGSQWIIYYGRNLEVLEQSSNSDAIEAAGVDIDASKGWRDILTQVAFYAMLQDINDELESLGWNGEGFEDNKESKNNKK